MEPSWPGSLIGESKQCAEPTAYACTTSAVLIICKDPLSNWFTLKVPGRELQRLWGHNHQRQNAKYDSNSGE